MNKILKKLESIQKFIENPNAKDSKGRKIDEFDKLCFVNEDLTELKNSLIALNVSSEGDEN